MSQKRVRLAVKNISGSAGDLYIRVDNAGSDSKGYSFSDSASSGQPDEDEEPESRKDQDGFVNGIRSFDSSTSDSSDSDEDSEELSDEEYFELSAEYYESCYKKLLPYIDWTFRLTIFAAIWGFFLYPLISMRAGWIHWKYGLEVFLIFLFPVPLGLALIRHFIMILAIKYIYWHCYYLYPYDDEEVKRSNEIMYLLEKNDLDKTYHNRRWRFLIPPDMR